jgi:hypothetical protein
MQKVTRCFACTYFRTDLGTRSVKLEGLVFEKRAGATILCKTMHCARSIVPRHVWQTSSPPLVRRKTNYNFRLVMDGYMDGGREGVNDRGPRKNSAVMVRKGCGDEGCIQNGSTGLHRRGLSRILQVRMQPKTCGTVKGGEPARCAKNT